MSRPGRTGGGCVFANELDQGLAVLEKTSSGLEHVGRYPCGGGGRPSCGGSVVRMALLRMLEL